MIVVLEDQDDYTDDEDNDDDWWWLWWNRGYLALDNPCSDNDLSLGLDVEEADVAGRWNEKNKKIMIWLFFSQKILHAWYDLKILSGFDWYKVK